MNFPYFYFQSNEITNTLYSFNWYEAPLSLQKDISIFMTASMKPIIMKSGFIYINTNSFYVVIHALFNSSLNKSNYNSFQILKTSYSYFTLLQNFAKQQTEKLNFRRCYHQRNFKGVVEYSLHKPLVDNTGIRQYNCLQFRCRLK